MKISDAGKPAALRRAANASATGVVEPVVKPDLISMICLKMSRARARSAGAGYQLRRSGPRTRPEATVSTCETLFHAAKLEHAISFLRCCLAGFGQIASCRFHFERHADYGCLGLLFTRREAGIDGSFGRYGADPNGFVMPIADADGGGGRGSGRHSAV